MGFTVNRYHSFSDFLIFCPALVFFSVLLIKKKKVDKSLLIVSNILKEF